MCDHWFVLFGAKLIIKKGITLLVAFSSSVKRELRQVLLGSCFSVHLGNFCAVLWYDSCTAAYLFITEQQQKLSFFSPFEKVWKFIAHQFDWFFVACPHASSFFQQDFFFNRRDRWIYFFTVFITTSRSHSSQCKTCKPATISIRSTF